MSTFNVKHLSKEAVKDLESKKADERLEAGKAARNRIREVLNTATSKETDKFDLELVAQKEGEKRTASEIHNDLMKDQEIVSIVNAIEESIREKDSLVATSNIVFDNGKTYVPASVENGKQIDVDAGFYQYLKDFHGVPELSKQTADNGKFEIEDIGWRDIQNAVASKPGADSLSATTPVSVYRAALSVIMNLKNRDYFTMKLRNVRCAANTDSLRYPREVVTTNTVAPVKQGGQYAEMTPSFEDVTTAVKKITGRIKVADEAFADVPQLGDFINQYLVRNMADKTEEQVLKGNNTDPNLAGLLTTQTWTNAGAGQNSVEYSASQNGKTTIGEVLNLLDKYWAASKTSPEHALMNLGALIKLMKSVDKEGRPIWADTIMGGRDRVWNIPIVISDHVPDNNIYMIKTSDYALLTKDGMSMEWGYNSDDFSKGFRTVRMSHRCNVLDFSPKNSVSIARLTGINHLKDEYVSS